MVWSGLVCFPSFLLLLYFVILVLILVSIFPFYSYVVEDRMEWNGMEFLVENELEGSTATSSLYYMLCYIDRQIGAWMNVFMGG